MAEETGWRNRIIGSGTKPADQFLHHPNNPKYHPPEQREALQGALREIGWLMPVVENVQTGFLIDGHERVWGALQNNEDVPYIQVSLSPEEEAYALATLDPIGMMARHDAAKLEELLHEVNSGEAGVQAMLAALAEDNGLIPPMAEPPGDPGAQIDKAAELREKWQTASGQLWVIPSKSANGDHRLLCGDSTSADDVARLMDGDKANAIVTDPPYGVSYERGKYDGTPRKSNMPTAIAGDDLRGDDQRRFISCVFALAKLHVEANAVIYMFSAPLAEGAHSMFGLVDSGIHIQSQLIWNKSHLVLGRSDYQWKHELIWYGYWDGKGRVWNGGRDQTTVIDHTRIPATLHPNEKPAGLMAYFVTNSTNAQDIVYEPFSGGGTTLAACEQTGRLGRAMEIEPKYVAVSLQRLADMGLEPRLSN